MGRTEKSLQIAPVGSAVVPLVVPFDSDEIAPRVVVMVPVGGVWVSFSLHAAVRWRQRRRADAPFDAALHQLATEVARHGVIARRRPRGIELYSLRQKLTTVAWLVVEPEAATFPLVVYADELVATTCIARTDETALHRR